MDRRKALKLQAKISSSWR